MSKARLFMLFAGTTMALSGLGSVAAPAAGGTVTVKATGSDTWSPSYKAVPRGTKVVWRNPSDRDHNVVSYKGPWRKSSSLSEGGSTSFTFRRRGTHKYRCTLHSSVRDGKCQGMCGTIVVR